MVEPVCLGDEVEGGMEMGMRREKEVGRWKVGEGHDIGTMYDCPHARYY